MKFVFTASLLFVGLLGGCATDSKLPMGMKAGEFVTFTCEAGKTFQARAAADGSTVRVRYEGGYELDNKGAGVYEAEGWKLVTHGPGAAELMHNGKSVQKNCKAS